VDAGRWRRRPDDGTLAGERFPGRSWLAVELHAGPDDAARLAMLLELATASGLPQSPPATCTCTGRAARCRIR
jgi:hypothetical protein